MKLFAIGTFHESSKEVTIGGTEFIDLLRLKPELIVIDDEALAELESRAKQAAIARIVQEGDLGYLKGFDPDELPASMADQQVHERLYGAFVALCDEELSRLFQEEHVPSDEDRFVLAGLDHDATFPITQVLERVTARDAIATH